MLSRDEVRRYAEHLHSEGVQPSGNALVAYCHTHHQRLSKRTALKYLRELAEAGVVFTPAAPAPLTEADDDPVHHRQPSGTLEPAPSHPCQADDPVGMAERAVKRAEAHLEDKRHTMDEAVSELRGSVGFLHNNERFGGWEPDRAAQDAALQYARACTQEYRNAWHPVVEARAQLEQAIRTYRRGQQEAWVVRHRKELVANMHIWEERLKTARSDYAHAEAKKNYGMLRFAYESEVAKAPTNGTQP